MGKQKSSKRLLKKRSQTGNSSSFFSSLYPSHGNRIGHEIWAIIFFLTAIFIFICIKHPESTGILGNIIHHITIWLFGIQGASFIPLFILGSTLSLLLTTIPKKIIFFASISGFISFIIFIESAFSKFTDAPFFRLYSDIGGLIGFSGKFILFKFLGPNGTLILLTGMFSISLILLFGFSINHLFHRLKIGLNIVVAALVSLRRVPVPSQNQSPFSGRMASNLAQFARFLFYKKLSPTDIRTPFDDIHSSLHAKPPIESPSLPVPPEVSDTGFETPFDTAFENETLTPFKPSSHTQPPSPDLPDDEIEPISNPVPSSLANFKLPPTSLLKSGKKINLDSNALLKSNKARAKILEMALSSFNVSAKVVNITAGPSVTRFELQPGEGVKISKITTLNKDIALKLAAPDIRIEAPIPGKALVGIEVPNESVNMISFKLLIDRTRFYDQPDPLLTLIGMSITGESIVMDLAKLPHILIAGATGSGKSVCINVIILSLLMRATPSEVKFLMIDPKKVELSLYDGIPHLLAPVVTNPHKAAATLKKWALIEMERRYDEFSKVGVKDIVGYNAYISERLESLGATNHATHHDPSPDDMPPTHSFEKLPYIVVVIDELADLMMVASQDVEQTICRLAQMARATGIHLVIATQRPSVNVVTGLIKANIPSRISFFLQSQIDSRTILDMSGAEKLLGKGDMLYSPAGSLKPKRVQGVFISESEVKNVVNWLKSQASPNYLSDIIDVEPINETQNDSDTAANTRDELYEEAKSLIMSTKYASTSYLQRKLRIGYNRAARIMDELTNDGVIAEYAGEKRPRHVSA